VYDAGNGFQLPGKLVRDDADTLSGDREADEAFDGAAATDRLYRQAFGRDSLDGHGMTLVSTVHYGDRYNNAFWNGQQMAYGDGDGILFQALTRSLSVIGHELSHGVVQFSGGLRYQDESGALNESFADVFGVLTVQYKRGQKAREASWLVGDGILGPDVQGEALRSLKAPGRAYDDPILGKDPQPYHMDLFVSTSSDNGGVHINSGIPNHAFYLLAQYLGGYAWEKAGPIWYDALQSINNPFATFVDWADETVARAHDRFGAGSLEALYTRRAWRLVGIAV
jgi:Zn-dependent metalloprotease